MTLGKTNPWGVRPWLPFLAWLLAAGGAAAAPAVRLEPERPSPGEILVVRVLGGERAQGLEARLGDRSYPLWPTEGGWEGLVAVDRDAEPGRRELWVVDPASGGADVTEFSVEPRAYGEQHIRVGENMVTLSDEDRARAAREATRIREALAGRTGERLWDGGFVRPVEGRVSGAFGVRRVYNGKPRGYHSGLDIAAPLGTPVRASGSGRVALVGDFFYTGNTVFVDHGLGLFTAYFHLDSVSVSPGAPVERGGVLGRVGSTGRSTGAHLHWGVYLAGTKADPQTLVRATRVEPVGDAGP